MSAIKELQVHQAIKRDDKYNRFNSYKILAYSDKIKEILNGGIPSPVEWVIYPSNVCGYKCAHCIMAREQIDHKNTLSEKAMNQIPLDAVKHNIPCVIFSGGGDPLLNRFTNDTARKLKEAGVLVGLNNQGYLLDDPTPYDFIRYSVDAATKEVYQKIHGVDGWDRVNRNIKNHAELRAKGKNIEMGLAFLVTPWNWTQAYDFCLWASQFNPDFIHIRPAYLDSDYLDEKYPGGGSKMKDEIIPRMRELAKKIEDDFPQAFFRIDKFEGFWTPKIYDKCRANTLMAVTSGDGAFLVCQDRGISKKEEYLRFGNYNLMNFQEIWWSDEHKEVIDSIDLENCPRCVENAYNEIIQEAFIKDKLKMVII